MSRVKRGTKRRARRKKYLRRTKGFFLTKSKLYQSSQEAANRADRYAYRDRRNKKRQYRRLWIQRIGAGARLNGMSYSQLMHGLKAAGLEIDRKYLTRPEDIREAYLDSLHRFNDRLEAICDANRCERLLCDTSRNLGELFADYLHQRGLRRRRW